MEPTQSQALAGQESQLLRSPARVVAVAAGLTIAAGTLLVIAYGADWLPSSPAASGHAAASAPSQIQLLWRLLLAAGVIIVLAKAFGGLARLVRQPEVVGEIVAGLVLGPSVMMTLAPGVYHAVLPAAVQPDVGLIAQAALTIFMFSVGLEVDLDVLRRQGAVIAAAGQAMTTVPFAVGLVAAIPLYRAFAGRGADVIAFTVFVGTALSVTAFPVLARIVEQAGLRGTRLGSLAMLCAAVCDVLAWCALAVALAMVRAQGPGQVLRTLALTVAVCAGAVLLAVVIRLALQMLARRNASMKVSDAALLLLILALIFGLGAVTDKIGIHDIFGGFLAGLVVPRKSEVLRPVTQRLDSLNRDLLLPLFFVSIGLQVDIWHAITRPVALAGGIALLAVAVAGKFGGAALVASAGGLPPRHALGLGALINARGVTDIVVISTGFSVGIINADALTVLILIALVTTMMTGPALRMLGPWHPAGQRAGPASDRSELSSAAQL
jgi:Kef-type K+ transport system membrane component KefB